MFWRNPPQPETVTPRGSDRWSRSCNAVTGSLRAPGCAVSRRVGGAGLADPGCRLHTAAARRLGRVLLSLFARRSGRLFASTRRCLGRSARRKCREAERHVAARSAASACFPYAGSIRGDHVFPPWTSRLPLPWRTHGDLRLPCAAGSRAGHARQGNLWRGTLVHSLPHHRGLGGGPSFSTDVDRGPERMSRRARLPVPLARGARNASRRLAAPTLRTIADTCRRTVTGDMPSRAAILPVEQPWSMRSATSRSRRVSRSARRDGPTRTRARERFEAPRHARGQPPR